MTTSEQKSVRRDSQHNLLFCLLGCPVAWLSGQRHGVGEAAQVSSAVPGSHDHSERQFPLRRRGRQGDKAQEVHRTGTKQVCQSPTSHFLPFLQIILLFQIEEQGSFLEMM